MKNKQNICTECRVGIPRDGFDRCDACMRQEYQQRLRKRLYQKYIPPRYQDADMSKVPSYLRDAFASVKDGKGVLLYGAIGCGKTYALYAYVKHCIDSAIDVEVSSYANLCLELRSTFSGQSEHDESDIIRRLSNIKILCLDDVGVSKKEKESDFSTRILRTIIDNRYNNLRSTILTSNKSLDELEKLFDERISSRLRGSCVQVFMSGSDKRTL